MLQRRRQNACEARTDKSSKAESSIISSFSSEAPTSAFSVHNLLTTGYRAARETPLSRALSLPGPSLPSSDPHHPLIPAQHHSATESVAPIDNQRPSVRCSPAPSQHDLQRLPGFLSSSNKPMTLPRWRHGGNLLSPGEEFVSFCQQFSSVHTCRTPCW